MAQNLNSPNHQHNWREIIIALFLFIGLLLLWQSLTTYFHLPIWLLPSPADVMQALLGTWPLLAQHAITTMIETTLGFSIAVLLGIGVGMILDLFPLIKRLFYPYLILSQTVPIVAIAPLLILWFGYGLLPKILIVILVCFFPVTISFIDGLAATDPDLMNLLRSMGATRLQILRYVRWPNALPSLFAGLKIAATYSVMAAVVGEWLGASSGLGVYLTRSSHSFLTDRVFAGIITISALSLFYFSLIRLAARVLSPWSFQIKKK